MVFINEKFLPLNIDQAIESKITSVEFRWEGSDNVIADLSNESPFWIVREKKLDQLIIEESVKYGTEILMPATVKITKQN